MVVRSKGLRDDEDDEDSQVIGELMPSLTHHQLVGSPTQHPGLVQSHHSGQVLVHPGPMPTHHMHTHSVVPHQHDVAQANPVLTAAQVPPSGKQRVFLSLV